MTTLYTDEILEAVVTLCKALAWTAIVEKGDLSYLPEPVLLALHVPSVYVKVLRIETEPDGATGHEINSGTSLRIVVIDEYDETTEDVMKKRVDRAQAIAEAFIGTSGADFDIGGASIAGFEIHTALPTTLNLEPDEDSLVSMNESRKLFAVSVDVSVEGRATR